MTRERLSPRARLIDKVRIDLATGCWLWTGEWVKLGYGMIKINGRTRTAHSVSYEEFIGPVPDGLELDHVCRNRLCLSPLHLEPVTHRENVLRGVGPAAINARKTHCNAGHDFSDPAVLGGSKNQRYCKICSRQHRLESEARLDSRTVCAHGHDLTDPVNIGHSNGYKVCKTCARIRVRAYNARKRAAALTSKEIRAADETE